MTYGYRGADHCGGGVARLRRRSLDHVTAPGGTPAAVTAKLYGELKEIIATAEVRQQIIKLGMLPVVSPPREELQGYINSEIERWGKVVRQAGLEGTQ